MKPFLSIGLLLLLLGCSEVASIHVNSKGCWGKVDEGVTIVQNVDRDNVFCSIRYEKPQTPR